MATPILVQLTADDVREALKLADASFQRNAHRRGQQKQYPNTPKSHQVGKVGEVACSSALAQHGIAATDNFRDPSSEGEADIVAGHWRLEVKSWSAFAWVPGGRCVTPGQLPYVRAKADAVVWCTVEGVLTAGRVLVRGWSRVDDLAQTVPRFTTVGRNSILNHQVNENAIRDLADLLAAIRDRAPYC